MTTPQGRGPLGVEGGHGRSCVVGRAIATTTSRSPCVCANTPTARNAKAVPDGDRLVVGHRLRQRFGELVRRAVGDDDDEVGPEWLGS